VTPCNVMARYQRFGSMLHPSSGSQTGIPQSSVLTPTLYSLYINDAPQTPGVQLAHFDDDMCIYATPQKGLRSQKAATRPHCNGGVVWSLEYKDQRQIGLRTSTYTVDVDRVKWPGVWVRVILLLTVSQSVLASSPFCKSWPDESPSLSVSKYVQSSFYLFI
jgi:hypothetical protein